MELGAFGFSVTAILNSQKDDEAWKRKKPEVLKNINLIVEITKAED